MDTEADAWVSFAPQTDDERYSFMVTAINTGLPLSGDSLQQLVKAYRQLYPEDAQVVDKKETPTAIYLRQHWDSDSGPLEHYAFFVTDDAAVVIVELSLPEEKARQEGDALWEALLKEVNYDTEAITQQPLYNDVWTFTAPNDLFEMDVPIAWYYSTSSDSEGTTVLDRFDSPDGQAFIESIVYDDGTPFSKQEAGKAALAILREFYADDLKVTDDQVQPDGSERLIWHSQKQGLSGVTFFEVRNDTTLLFLNMVSSDDTVDMYADLFEAILSSYLVP